VPMDGGWQTVTTKARLNEHLPIPFYVFQKNWEWFMQDTSVTNPDDPDKAVVYPFSDVYYIHHERWTNNYRVMLYSTHPKYPDYVSKRKR